jgi:protocatechuate 3,4-dioxygenase beta subunit
MPRYYFPSWDGENFLPDEDGLEFEGIEQARTEAVRGLAEMARDSLCGSADERILKIRVVDQEGKPVHEVRLTFEVASEDALHP